MVSIESIVREILDKKLELEVMRAFNSYPENLSDFYNLLNSLDVMQPVIDEWNPLDYGEKILDKLMEI